MAKRKKQKMSKAGVGALTVVGLMAFGSVAGEKPKESAAAAVVKAPTKAASRTSLSKHMQNIRYCESTDDYTAVNKKSPTHTGGFQFADSTWAAYKTGYTHAKDAPASLQDEIATKEHAKNGDAPWLASKPCWSKR